MLKHEVVHVITLQQTEFNIPHWYTEALAVESEGFPAPAGVEQDAPGARARRAKLLNLDTINLGFIRPKEPDDRQMAYCQAQLYAQYMLKRFGPDALIKMLDAYRRGLTTDRAIDACFHVEKADFEAGYLDLPRRGRQDDPHPGRARRSRSSSRSSSGCSRRSPTTPT